MLQIFSDPLLLFVVGNVTKTLAAHRFVKATVLQGQRPRGGLACVTVLLVRRPKVAKKLYVGNLPYGTSDSELQRLFEEYGTVTSAQVIVDRDSGRSKGFGFVEMGNQDEAQAAIDGLNGQDMNGRPLTVNEARPREDRGGRSGGGRGGYGGGRRY